jgi:hypothetical protein
MRRGRLEISVYWKDEIGQWWKPYFYRKFVKEAELEVKEGLVRIYGLGNECYLGIVFVDGKVRDGLTVVRERKRNDRLPVACMMPLKEGNIDPLPADIYWNLLDLPRRSTPSQEELEPFLEFRTKIGVVHFYLLRRVGRDNIDLYIGVNPVGRKILVQGKAGETYLVEKASIPQVASLKSAIHFLEKINENFGIEEVIVLDEKVYARTGLSPALSEITKMVA